MQFNMNRKWFERMAAAEDEGDCTVISPQFRAFMEAKGPYTVHVHGQSELITADARYDKFEAAVAHARSAANWNIKADIRDEPTGNVIHTVQPYNEEKWLEYARQHGYAVEAPEPVCESS